MKAWLALELESAVTRGLHSDRVEATTWQATSDGALSDPAATSFGQPRTCSTPTLARARYRHLETAGASLMRSIAAPRA
jgi:hypothetical protein